MFSILNWIKFELNIKLKYITQITQIFNIKIDTFKKEKYDNIYKIYTCIWIDYNDSTIFISM